MNEPDQHDDDQYIEIGELAEEVAEIPPGPSDDHEREHGHDIEYEHEEEDDDNNDMRVDDPVAQDYFTDMSSQGFFEHQGWGCATSGHSRPYCQY